MTEQHTSFSPYVPSSAPLALPLTFAFEFGELVRPVALPPDALSLLDSRLWKKFCNTSCCVWPPVGLGEPAGSVGDDALDREFAAERGTARVAGARPDVALDNLRPLSGPVLMPRELEPPPTVPSISVSARSTLGKLKLLLPMGPTIPAATLSLGFRNAPRGSRSGFFDFSS